MREIAIQSRQVPCRRAAPGSIDRCFRRLQLLSAALYSLGHGAKDAQKTMGIIGAGLPIKIGAIRWGIAYRIVWAWILTIPASALVAALVWWVISLAGLAD